MTARCILAERARRERLFPGMDEPAWLILLDLYDRPGENISVTSACLASYAPPTTALRHIGLLVDGGLVEREADPFDRRRVYLRLTDAALSSLGDYFTSRIRWAA